MRFLCLGSSAIPSAQDVSLFTGCFLCDAYPMRKRKRAAIAVIVVVAAAGVIAYLARENELVYQGRSLSAWFRLWADSSRAEDATEREHQAEEAAHAIRQIGTNAIPTLLRWLSYEPPRTQSGASWLAHKVPAPLFDRIVGPLLFGPGERAGSATSIFVILGQRASPAVPDLTVMLQATNKPFMTRNAAWCLAAIGDEGLPALTAALANPQLSGCRDAAYVLGINGPFKFGTNVVSAVPLLARCASDKDPELAAAAVKALGRIGQAPGIALPAITNALLSPSSGTRREAIHALSRFAGEKGRVVPALLPALTDTNLFVRFAASNLLQQLAPEELTNRPPTQP